MGKRGAIQIGQAPCAGNSLAQGGTIIVMFACVLLVLLGFAGLAIEVGQLLNRRAEVQTMADAAALAAARQLNGTAAGVSAAVAAASDRLTNITDGLTYQYGHAHANWSDAAIAFAQSANGPWLDSVSASSAPQGLGFVKIDTWQLDSAVRQVPTIFMRILSSAFDTMTVSVAAVAGPYSINVTPLAICAMSTSPAAAGGSELVQYGFRRGISYDLMQLDPNDTDGIGANYLIDPIAPPGTTGAAADFAMATVQPFVCTGSLAMPRVSGGQITVQGPFPLGSLYSQLNSRFGTYSAPCNAITAPPDKNVKPYSVATFFGTASAWMNSSTPSLTLQSAAQYPATASGSAPLWTYADQSPLPAGTGPDKYGPLWAYARAVPYSAYSPGVPEPAAGYTPFPASQASWNSLYPVNTGGGSPSLKTSVYPSTSTSNPSGTPYQASSGNFYQAAPAGTTGIAGRRVLNVALLSCPVPSGSSTSATVLAVAKFLMTVPADANHLYAEFGGLAPEPSLSGNLELQQ